MVSLQLWSPASDQGAYLQLGPGLWSLLLCPGALHFHGTPTAGSSDVKQSCA